MKKILSLLLAGVMTVSVALTGCGSSEAGSSEGEGANNVAALEVLETVWGAYAEDEKFAIIGGDANNMVDNAPGAFDISDAAMVDTTLAFPEANVASIDEAASMVHMMNANTFTAGAYHVIDAAQTADIAAAIEENIAQRQWMCGFPEVLLIAQVGDNTVVAAFGAADLMENFKAKLTESYESAAIITEESLM